MPRTVRTAQTIVRTGLTPSYTAVDAANGEVFDNAVQDKFLHVKNGSGAGITVTVGVGATVDGLTVPDLAISIGAGAEKIIGPFPNSIYGQADVDSGITQGVLVDYSAGTSVTAALFARGSTTY